MRATLFAILGLLAACADPVQTYVAPPSDAAIIERLHAKRADYETVVRVMTAEPRIERIERVPGKRLMVLPEGADPVRLRAVLGVMEQEGILYAATSEDRTISLTLFENLSPKGYQSRMLAYGPGYAATDSMTGDAGATVTATPGVAFRDLGEGWHLRASSWPPEGT